MITSPKVSIIVPTYNGERYIAKSLQSCLVQTYPNIEIIIVNDCSTDGTKEIIEKVIKNRKNVRVIDNVVNRKLPSALNVGFGAASGDYLTWSSDDNYYHESAIARMLWYLQSHNAEFVYTDWTEIDGCGREIKKHIVDPPAKLIKKCVVGPSFLYTANLARQVGDYDDKLEYVEDYDFWLRVSEHTKIEVFHENLYYYRSHDASMTSRKPKIIKGKTIEIRRRSIDKIQWIGTADKVEARIDIALSLWRLGRRLRAVSAIIAVPRREVWPMYFRLLLWIIRRTRESLRYFK